MTTTTTRPGFLLAPSPDWFPYFGNQRRFVPYVLELLVGLGAGPGDTLFETNAGSQAVSFHASKVLGMATTSNDLGAYATALGLALSTGDEEHVRRAALGCALIEEHGYLVPEDARPDHARLARWQNFIRATYASNPNRAMMRVTRGDLFERLVDESGDYVYCDFAWPWRDGAATEEYEVTADTLSRHLGDDEPVTFRMATARRILDDVITYLDLARPRFRYVILSNQSSNYPTPDVIEAHMRACGHVPVISRRLTVPAEHVDNLGRDDTFTEYQYVFEGTR